ncbi:uncharacterized protein TNCV_3336361 [Trichonephila clavipes]|nr:uncharacterized protein TNCV_3336361 [Trichonephila clavipes]
MPNSLSEMIPDQVSIEDKSGDSVGQGRAKAPHTITPAVGAAVCRCKAKAGLRRLPQGLHTQTRLSSLLRLNLDSLLKTIWLHSAGVQFPRARHHSKRRRRWVSVKGGRVMGAVIPNVFQSGAPSGGFTCAWIAADEAVDCVRAFLAIWWSFR